MYKKESNLEVVKCLSVALIMEACNVNVTFESGQKLMTGFDHLIKPSASSSSASGCNK